MQPGGLSHFDAEVLFMASLTRPIRTAAQGAPAWVITEAIDAWAYNMDDRQYGVTVLLLTMLLSWAQALIEDRLGKGVLRDQPPPQNIVVDKVE